MAESKRGDSLLEWQEADLWGASMPLWKKGLPIVLDLLALDSTPLCVQYGGRQWVHQFPHTARSNTQVFSWGAPNNISQVIIFIFF